MSEFGPNNYSEKSPLRLLNNELRREGRTYGDLIIALDSYVQSELKLSDEGTERVIQDMLESGVLPGLDLFEQDRELAIEQLRLAIWRYVMPLAEGMMESDELDAWMPNAMAVVAPRDGRHLPERCRRTRGVNDSCCAIGNCPVMVVSAYFQQSMITPDFTSMEYVIDPVKARMNTLRRLASATARGIIPPAFATTLELQYQGLCDEAFQNYS